MYVHDRLTYVCPICVVPTIVKTLFGWNWQCSTLNRGDELVNLLLGCLQPFQLFVPDYTTVDGRRSGLGSRFFAVLCLFHETKVAQPGVLVYSFVAHVNLCSSVGQKSEPNYNCVLPHRDPLRCPIGALALLLWFIFDEEKLVSLVPDWDWSKASSWRKVADAFSPLELCPLISVFRSN